MVCAAEDGAGCSGGATAAGDFGCALGACAAAPETASTASAPAHPTPSRRVRANLIRLLMGAPSTVAAPLFRPARWRNFAPLLRRWRHLSCRGPRPLRSPTIQPAWPWLSHVPSALFMLNLLEGVQGSVPYGPG